MQVQHASMQLRPFGSTGLRVSERGFGAWAIGGRSYGPVEPRDALDALAQAEELGCNFVDTAAVYGDSETLLGHFLAGRRSKWIVASKYSGQPQGMSALVDEQLQRLGTDHIDFYQLHWAPRGKEERLYDELERLKRAGKIRFCGVSLRSAADIDHVAAHAHVDGVQLCLSLLDPDPMASRRDGLEQRGLAVVARSVLRGGFLAGTHGASTVFSHATDQRSQWSQERIRTTARQAQAFSFLAEAVGSLHTAALAYPLSFKQVSTVLVSCKTAAQARANFATTVPSSLDAALLKRVEQTQRQLGLHHMGRAGRAWRKLLTILGRGER